MSIVTAIKTKGNESFKEKNYYDVLWKYDHAIRLLHAFPSLNCTVALILCNAAMSCLKLGETKQIDLIQNKDEACWYCFGFLYANFSLYFNPAPEVALKVRINLIWDDIISQGVVHFN